MNKDNVWIVTDLDGTLIDVEYNIKPAINTLNWLKDMGIPVIPCTSKTAAEVEKFRIDYQLTDPYIVENGSAIYGLNYDKLGISEVDLGRKHSEIKPFLDKLSHIIGYRLIAFEDLPTKEIRKLTGLSNQEISLAVKRQWSVPFLNPCSDDMTRLTQVANDFNLTIVQGNRMSHLLDKSCSKGNAINRLKSITKQSNIIVIGLGDSPNDRSLLEVADIPIVVPGFLGPNKCFIEDINACRFKLAPAPHSEGWAQAVKSVLKQTMFE